MPALWRPDDHHRNLRRRAPCAFTIAEPDQHRYLMIAVATLPALQRRPPSTPAARRSRKATSSQGRPAFSTRRAHARRSQDPPKKSSSSSFPPRTIRATDPRTLTSAPSRPQNPHRPHPTKRAPLPARGFLLGRLSNAGPGPRTTLTQGADVRNPRMRARKSTANFWSR